MLREQFSKESAHNGHAAGCGVLYMDRGGVVDSVPDLR
jgi:hypothetical protein